MKQILIKTSVLLSFTVAACTQDVVVETTQNYDNGELLQELSITGKDFQFENETRSSVTIGESGASFAWDEDDVIGIFPDKGDQVSFAMEQGAGTQAATFSGGGWALKSSAKYAAYYPHVYENRDMTKIPVSYVGQTQNGNNNTDHIGAYDFMAAGVSTPSNGKVAFDMQHLGCLVQLTITIPNTGTLSSVTLSSDEEIFVEKGYIDLSATTPSIVPTQTTSSLNIDLKDVVTTVTNETVIIYFMMAPVDMTGKTLAIKVGDIVGIVEANNFKKGKAYQLKTTNPIAVDLGLSVKWANCNIGAHSPEEFGNYYAWGETETKTDYTAYNSIWWNVKHINLPLDSKGNIQSTYDASIKEWGNSWRLPTKSELDELKDNCKWEWSAINGVKGYILTSKINNNSIFLPSNDSSFMNGKESGFGSYWSSTPCSDTTLDSEGRYAGAIAFYAKDYNISENVRIETNYFLRWCKRGIRPVYNE